MFEAAAPPSTKSRPFKAASTVFFAAPQSDLYEKRFRVSSSKEKQRRISNSQNETFEAQFAFQDCVQRVTVLTAECTIEFVVRAHHSERTGANSFGKWPNVEF